MGHPSDAKKRLGDWLVQEGVITPAQLEKAVDAQRARGGRLGDILVDMGFCAEDRVLAVLAKRANVPWVASLSAESAPDPETLALIPARTARARLVFPMKKEGLVLTVALADPFLDITTVDDLKIQTGCDVRVVLASEREIAKALDRHYPADDPSLTDAPDDSIPEETRRMDTVLTALLESALKAGAEHIHLDPGPSGGQVRFRVRGRLEFRVDLPPRHMPSLAARIKQVAGMNSAERWLSQDGRLRWSLSHGPVDVRVSTVPTWAGEKLLLTLLDPARARPLNLESLGLPGEDLAAFREMLKSPRGLVLVTGPSGAGKTSTLYAALEELKSPDRHILTMEDPVERFLDGITQVQTRADARMTMASGIRTLRRQDPDVLMAGDLPGLDAVEAALEAALDCLTLAAVTAPDGAGAFQRLMDLGASPALLAARLTGVLAQRLVRTICPNCRDTYTLSLRELMSAGVGEKEIRSAQRAASFSLQRGRGCGQCLGTGYAGTAAVFEVIPATDAVRRRVAEWEGPGPFARDTAERVSLREAAVRKMLAGDTTLEEALTVD